MTVEKLQENNRNRDLNEKAGAQYRRDGKYIYFGEYPQTIKASDVTVDTTVDSDGYYMGSDGYRYAKVTATPYSSWNSDSDKDKYKFSNSEKVMNGKEYYFKVEPIKWRILEENGGNAFLLCDSAIDTRIYDACSSNYADSEIRKWLNNEFYKKAFSGLQQEVIETTNVDNSLASTCDSKNKFVCENTNDKVFLLSVKEVTNSAYGFNSDYSNYDSARIMKTSDYSRATGAYMNTGSYYGSGWWRLRSPHNYYSDSSRLVSIVGYVSDHYVSDASGDVVPALQIRLN